MIKLTEFEQSLRFFSKKPKKFIESFQKSFKPTEQQCKVLEIIPKAIEEDKSIAVKSGHGTGKTAIGANIILWFITVFPFPKIICSAPSKGQLMDVLWPELSKWQQEFMFGEVFEWTRTRFYHKEHPENWFASARTANKPESLAGVHGDHVLVLIDEASGVPQEVYETLEGAETEKGALKILLSNPTKTVGEFFDAFHGKNKYYYTFTFNSEESERVKKEYCEKLAKKYGKDSNVYRIRVLGEFPKKEDDVVIGLDEVERSHEKWMNLEENDFKKILENEEVVLGVDVARFGDDESTIFSRNEKIIQKEATMKKADTMQLVGKIVNLRKTKYKKIKKCYYCIDLTGVGGGVVDRLNQMITEGDLPKNDTVIGVENNRKAINIDEYGNIITELWFMMKEWLNSGGMLPPDSAEEDNNIQQQLCSRKYEFDSKGRFVIESKKIVKKRIKGSPDRADGAILTLTPLVIKGELLYSDGVNDEEDNKNVYELKVKNEEFMKKALIDRLKFYKQK